MLDFLLAAALLSAPPPAAADDPPPAEAAPLDYRRCRQALRRYGVDWELLDRRELLYYFTRDEDFRHDLALLRRRAADLADAPPQGAATRFPERACVTELMAFNRRYRAQLEGRQATGDDSPGCVAAVADADRLWALYDLVRDAECEYYHVYPRRTALKKLEAELGPADFWAGRLPPHVPLWAFKWID